MKYEFEVIYTHAIKVLNNKMPLNIVWIRPEYAGIGAYDSKTGIIFEFYFYRDIDPSGDYKEMVTQLTRFLIKEML